MCKINISEISLENIEMEIIKLKVQRNNTRFEIYELKTKNKETNNQEKLLLYIKNKLFELHEKKRKLIRKINLEKKYTGEKIGNKL